MKKKNYLIDCFATIVVLFVLFSAMPTLSQDVFVLPAEYADDHNFMYYYK